MNEKTRPKCWAGMLGQKRGIFECLTMVGTDLDPSEMRYQSRACVDRERDQLANRVGHLVCAGNRILELKGCACWLTRTCKACEAAEREWKRVSA